MARVTRRQYLSSIAIFGLCSQAKLAHGQQLTEWPMDGVLQQAAKLDQLHALVVHQNGRPLLAESFRGPQLSEPHNIKSVSKTLLALLTGVAIDKGLIDGPQQLVLPLLGYEPYYDKRDTLTIDHLLSMRTGLRSTSGARYGAWVNSSDWVRYAIDQPVIAEPGGQFIYSTGGWHVLGAALSEASGLSLHQMAEQWLAEPMDFHLPQWVHDPQGRHLGGNEMAISPMSLARIGDMVLQGGRWNDQQYINRSWITTSWQPRGVSPFSGDHYGYGWFLTRFAGMDAAYGRGFGGQMLVVVPEKGLSLAITSDPTRPARSGGYFAELKELVTRVVISVG